MQPTASAAATGSGRREGQTAPAAASLQVPAWQHRNTVVDVPPTAQRAAHRPSASKMKTGGGRSDARTATRTRQQQHHHQHQHPSQQQQLVQSRTSGGGSRYQASSKEGRQRPSGAPHPPPQQQQDASGWASVASFFMYLLTATRGTMSLAMEIVSQAVFSLGVEYLFLRPVRFIVQMFSDYTKREQFRRTENRYLSIMTTTESQQTWITNAAYLDNHRGMAQWQRTAPVGPEEEDEKQRAFEVGTEFAESVGGTVSGSGGHDAVQGADAAKTPDKKAMQTGVIPYCNAKDIIFETTRVIMLAKSGNRRAMDLFLRSCLHRNNNGTSHPLLFRYYTGTKSYVEDYNNAVAQLIQVFSGSLAAADVSAVVRPCTGVLRGYAEKYMTTLDSVLRDDAVRKRELVGCAVPRLHPRQVRLDAQSVAMHDEQRGGGGSAHRHPEWIDRGCDSAEERRSVGSDRTQGPTVPSSSETHATGVCPSGNEVPSDSGESQPRVRPLHADERFTDVSSSTDHGGSRMVSALTTRVPSLNGVASADHMHLCESWRGSERPNPLESTRSFASKHGSASSMGLHDFTISDNSSACSPLLRNPSGGDEETAVGRMMREAVLDAEAERAAYPCRSEYVDHIVRWAYLHADDEEASHMSEKECITTLCTTLRCYGRTALMLSGGSTLGVYHVGVCRALFEAGLLPTIISGSSAGSIIAAIVCTRSEGDLRDLLCDESFTLEALQLTFFDSESGPLQKLRRLMHTGAVMDGKILMECMRTNIGDLTFAEAYQRTGRVLNICVTSDHHEGTHIERHLLLNCVTSPNVVVWSAVSASCALPGLFTAVQLLQKTSDRQFAAYLPGQLWCDGSVARDLPREELANLFNVNYFIVSQVNPHVVIFMEKPISPLSEKKQSWMARVWYGVTQEARHWVLKLFDLGILSKNGAFEVSYMFLTQRYDGDITILPMGNALHAIPDYVNIIANPSREYLAFVMTRGQLRTWPHLNKIRWTTMIERTLVEQIKAHRELHQAKKTLEIVRER